MWVYSHLDALPSGKATERITEGCLVLEGGAFRGVYTSGVLDCLMMNDVNLQATVGVSAGALNGYNYVAGEIGRSARINLTYRHDSRWVGRKALLSNHGLVGFDFVFGEMKQQLPVDEERFYRSDRRFVAVATNCETGQPTYFEKDCGQIEKAIRASASMPVASQTVRINGMPYLDGGCSVKVPVEWAIQQGYKKILVVCTRERSYRRSLSPENQIVRRLYRQYPNLLHSFDKVNENYNQTAIQLDEMEKQGRIMVLAPSDHVTVHRLEWDMEKLGQLYKMGYEDTKDKIQGIKDYLDIES